MTLDVREPSRQSSTAVLARVFREPFLHWLEVAEKRVPHVEFRVTETLRSRERQAWLYAQGREEPFLHAPRATWTMESRHRWGLAADLAMIRKSTGQAIWEIPSWRWLYEYVPLEPFGLRHIAPLEWVHVELARADEVIKHAGLLGLEQV